MRLLPTPAASQYGSNQSLSPGAAVRPSLAAIDKLLPTPSAADSQGGHERRGGNRSGELLLKGIARQDRFGDYATAVTRWEQVNGPAPDPTEGRRLSARLVEWLMGLSAGWVVDVPGLTRNQQLHALGNGVVPQQAAFAIRMLLTRLALQEAS